MKTLYLDIFSGLSGDMFIGAMIDLGVDAQEFAHELEKLGLDEFHLHVSRQERGAIRCSMWCRWRLRRTTARPFLWVVPCCRRVVIARP